MENLQVWKDRCDSLTGHLHTLANSSELNGIPREQTIKALLENLRDFGSGHFNFFFNDFKKKAGAKLLDENNEFPKAAVLRWIIDQISYDMEVITRAWDQRRLNSIYEKALAQADTLGEIALNPAIDCGYISADTTVLSYFQKSYSVRLIPYANVALLGIPITALTVPRDYLAIPHEVAHYVFRHGTLPKRQGNKTIHTATNETISHFLNKEIAKILTEDHDYLQKWIEEVFADMYGCMVAGPVIALDFQDLQMDDPLEEFGDATIDYEDPVPLLRPDTYAKTLFKLNKQEWNNAAFALHERWKNYRAKYWENFKQNYGDKKFRSNVDLSTPTFVFNVIASEVADDIRDDSVNLDPNKPLDAIIDLIWTEFLEDMEKGVAYDRFYWSGSKDNVDTILSESQVKNLYTFSDQEFAKLSIVSQATEPLTQTTIWEKWVKERFEPGKQMQEWNRTAKKKAKEAKHHNPGRVYGWYELAYADGWVTRGPEPNPVGD